MTTPTILDKHDNPLSVGDRAQWQTFRVTIHQLVFPQRLFMPYVLISGETFANQRVYTIRETDQPNTYRCPDLERIQDQPERSRT